MTELSERLLRIVIEVSVWVAGAICLLVLLTGVVRWRATSRTLRSRVRLSVLPTEAFDPTAEEVLRYAHQLTRIHRTVLGFLDRPASAVRIRLELLPDGRVAYLLEGPARAASVLRVGGYEDVELRVVEGEEIPAPQGLAFTPSPGAGGSAEPGRA